MQRIRAMQLLIRKAMIAVVGVLIAAATMGPSPVAASPRSAFCSPHRTLQSFGGRPVRGFAAHLVVGPGSVRRGTFSTFRVLNEGTDELAELSERIQRWTGTSWVRMLEPYPELGAIVYVPPRSVTGCSGPLTGKHWPPGKYRYLVKVEAFERSPKPTPSELHWLSATFLLRRGSD
jgi:hypothetical protein